MAIPYDYLDQSIQASALVQVRDDDSFYNPSLGHTGFAADGTHYTAGVQDSVSGPIYASWFTEVPGAYRGTKAVFPSAGLILLSKVSLVILDETTRSLNLWMQFLLGDQLILANNFNGSDVGFTPRSISYADGVISIAYEPDEGATNLTLVGTSPPFDAWSSSAAYAVRDQVVLSGNLYTCIQDNTNQPPPNATFWTLGSGPASNLVVTVDFVQDRAYLDVAV